VVDGVDVEVAKGIARGAAELIDDVETSSLRDVDDTLKQRARLAEFAVEDS
jgi:hypothetical protein